MRSGSGAAMGPPEGADEGNGPALEISGASVDYGSHLALRSLDLSVARGETVALLGPSGSGKTTLLYAIAGFLPLSAGEIRIGGRLVSARGHSEAPERRPLAMVFQHYGLWPHLDALQTVAYPLERSGMPRREARTQAASLLSDMHIEHLAARRPAELSGGEQQRVGLARALARHPDVYLLDEPSAHLDTVLKADLRVELARRMRADGAAALHATHDVEEALSVADRVALLRDGAVVQIDTPEGVYGRPVDAWAARLTGPVSFVDVSALPTQTLRGGSGDRDGVAAVRPDWVHVGGPLAATVRDVHFRGTHTDYRLETVAGELLLREPGPPHLPEGTEMTCRIERAWPLRQGTGPDDGPYPSADD